GPQEIAAAPASRRRYLLLRQLSQHRKRDLADLAYLGAQRLQQFARFGRLFRRQEARQRNGSLLLGHENRRMLHQVAQDFFTLIVAAVRKVDLRQRELGKGGVVLATLIGHFQEQLLRFGEFALVGLDRAQVVLGNLRFVAARVFAAHVRKDSQRLGILCFLSRKCQPAV